jgi:hypothetical protein
MVHDASAPGTMPGGMPVLPRRASGLLGAFGRGVARLHVDLCRLASAICPRLPRPASARP